MSQPSERGRFRKGKNWPCKNHQILIMENHRKMCYHLGRAKRIWYLSPMRAAKVQASLRIRAVSPEPSLLAHTSSESRGTFRQKARSLAPLNGWACAVKVCHDGMLEDTNSLGAAHFQYAWTWIFRNLLKPTMSLLCSLLFVHKVTWGKAFSDVLAVLRVFDPIIYPQRTNATPPFFHNQASRRWQTNRQSTCIIL